VGYGGPTWDTAGTLELGSGNTFDVADATEDDPEILVYDQAWWTLTTTLSRVTLTDASYGFLLVYTGDSYAERDEVFYLDRHTDPATVTFNALPGVEYHVLMGNGIVDPLSSYTITWAQASLTASPWLDDLQDDPDNYVIVTDGDLRLENPNPEFNEHPLVRPVWMNDVVRGGQARTGDYRAQEEIDLDPPILSAEGCVRQHAYAANQGAITWSSLTCPTVPIDTTADTQGPTTSTGWSLEHEPSVGLVSGHVYGTSAGPSYALWYLPVRDNLPPWGALDITPPNPVDYGYPADAVLEWEDEIPDLLGVELADGDPATSGSSDYPNKWVLNSNRGPEWVDGFTTEWLIGAVDAPNPGTDDRPWMSFDYEDGDVGWNEVPGSDAGWREAWTEEYGTFAPTADSVVVAWPGTLPAGFGDWDRLARIAVKFVLRARRFRFLYEGGTVPPRRISRRLDGATHGAARSLGGRNTVQSGNRVLGTIL
jgi:hypothetical protein